MNSGIGLVACFALPLVVAVVIGIAVGLAAVRRNSRARGVLPDGGDAHVRPPRRGTNQRPTPDLSDPSSPLYTAAMLGMMNSGHAPPTHRGGDHAAPHADPGHPPTSNSIYDAAGGNTDFTNNYGGLADFGSTHDAGGGFDAGGGGGFDAGGGGGGGDGGGGGGGGD